MIKIAIYLSQGLNKKRPSYRGNLQLSKENIQHFKKLSLFTFSYFCGSVLPSWILIQIRIVNPDPGSSLNQDPVRIQIHNTDCYRTADISQAQVLTAQIIHCDSFNRNTVKYILFYSSLRNWINLPNKH